MRKGIFVITVYNLHLFYGDYPAIKNFSFQFRSQKIYGLVGENGAGKTTLLRMLSGIIEPTLGTIEIDGMCWANHETQLHQEISFVADTFPVDAELLAKNELKLHSLRFDPTKNSFTQLSNDPWLMEFAGKKGNELSRGMKQRLALSKALVHQPKWIILDEPASGLDPAGRIKLRDTLRGIRSQGCGVIISSHILSDLQDICDEVLFFEKGLCTDQVQLGKSDTARFFVLKSSSEPAHIQSALNDWAEVTWQKNSFHIYPSESASKGEINDKHQGLSEKFLIRLLEKGIKIVSWESETNLEAIYHDQYLRGGRK